MGQKIVAVTGGSSGIGRATALRFAAAGHTVYDLSRHSAGDPQIRHIDADVTRAETLNAAAADANGVEVFTTTPAGAQSTTPDSGSTAATRGNKYDAANALLAYHIQRQLVQKVQFSDRGVKRKRLGVLYDTAMPAVLVEAGFISGSKDQKKLFSAAERSKIAKSIAEGILSYKKTVESVKPAEKH